MIETLTIITLSVLFLIFFRPGKTPPLDNPLVIERPGQYHMTLAPQLNLAQPFIEAIVTQFGSPCNETGYSTTQCFEVNDKSVTSHGHKSFLLTITFLNGMLYFQAINPQPGKLSIHDNAISEFTKNVLGRINVTGDQNLELDDRIVKATFDAAQQRNVKVNHLFQ